MSRGRTAATRPEPRRQRRRRPVALARTRPIPVAPRIDSLASGMTQTSILACPGRTGRKLRGLFLHAEAGDTATGERGMAGRRTRRHVWSQTARASEGVDAGSPLVRVVERRNHDGYARGRTTGVERGTFDDRRWRPAFRGVRGILDTSSSQEREPTNRARPSVTTARPFRGRAGSRNLANKADPVATSMKNGTRRKLRKLGTTLVPVIQNARRCSRCGTHRKAVRGFSRINGLVAISARRAAAIAATKRGGRRSRRAGSGPGDRALVDRRRVRARPCDSAGRTQRGYSAQCGRVWHVPGNTKKAMADASPMATPRSEIRSLRQEYGRRDVGNREGGSVSDPTGPPTLDDQRAPLPPPRRLCF